MDINKARRPRTSMGVTWTAAVFLVAGLVTLIEGRVLASVYFAGCFGMAWYFAWQAGKGEFDEAIRKSTGWLPVGGLTYPQLWWWARECLVAVMGLAWPVFAVTVFAIGLQTIARRKKKLP